MEDKLTYYDYIAQGYDELHKTEQIKKLKIIENHITINPNFKLLDVGCGSGISTLYWNCNLYGIDPSIKLLEIASKKIEKYNSKKNLDKNQTIKFIQANAENIPFENNYFDIVISLTAIQNFKDLKKGLSEIKRVGKNNFILTYLKASLKSNEIEKEILNQFNIIKRLEEEKDIIFICN